MRTTSSREVYRNAWIRVREEAGTLRLAGCWFDIGLGELHELRGGAWMRVGDQAGEP